MDYLYKGLRYVFPQNVKLRRVLPFLPFAALLFGALFCCSQILFTHKKALESVNFGDGYTIEVFEEAEGILDPSWDPDIPYPGIYYQVRQGKSVIVPQTYLGLSFPRPLDIKIALAEDGNLIVIYDEQGYSNGIIIVLDATNPSYERWEAPHSEWPALYERVREENPEMPSRYGTN